MIRSILLGSAVTFIASAASAGGTVYNQNYYTTGVSTYSPAPLANTTQNVPGSYYQTLGTSQKVVTYPQPTPVYHAPSYAQPTGVPAGYTHIGSIDDYQPATTNVTSVVTSPVTSTVNYGLPQQVIQPASSTTTASSTTQWGVPGFPGAVTYPVAPSNTVTYAPATTSANTVYYPAPQPNIIPATNTYTVATSAPVPTPAPYYPVTTAPVNNSVVISWPRPVTQPSYVAPQIAAIKPYDASETIRTRITRQRERLDRAIERDRLSTREARMLRRELRTIRRNFRNFLNTGNRINKAEEAILKDDLKTHQARIKFFKNNDARNGRGHGPRRAL